MQRIAQINTDSEIQKRFASGRGALPQMHEKKRSLQFPIEEIEYQPEPDTVAGFITDMVNLVDELLMQGAAPQRPPAALGRVFGG